MTNFSRHPSTGETIRRCGYCGLTFPATPEYFYMTARGYFGDCKTCAKRRVDERTQQQITAAATVSRPQAARLLPIIRRLPLDGALKWQGYTLRYASFERGHNQYRLVKGFKTVGIHLVRSDRYLPLIHAKLADLLVSLGAAPDNLQLCEFVPPLPSYRQYRYGWLFPDHKQWLKRAADYQQNAA